MLWCSPLFAFQKHFIGVKEFEMLELETLVMLVNTVLYEYGPKSLKYGQSPI